MPRFYFDLGKARDLLAKGQTPWTPVISVFFGLEVALERLAAEGLVAIWERHARLGRMVREGVKALGLELFADERFASDTVTAVKAPAGVDVTTLRKLLEDEYNLILAGGQARLAGKIFRIGHLGWVTEDDIERTLAALSEALPRVGFAGALGR
jgi:aspartate aminotransferase-like enzyme